LQQSSRQSRVQSPIPISQGGCGDPGGGRSKLQVHHLLNEHDDPKIRAPLAYESQYEEQSTAAQDPTIFVHSPSTCINCTLIRHKKIKVRYPNVKVLYL
jgi:hypothetical protein